MLCTLMLQVDVAPSTSTTIEAPTVNTAPLQAAEYSNDSPRISGASYSTEVFEYNKKVGKLEFLSRLGATGFGDGVDAVVGLIANVSDPDTKIGVRLYVETDRKKEKIFDWRVYVSSPIVDDSIEGGGGRAIDWTLIELPTKEAALKLLESYPELVNDLYRDTNVE